eukprot:scaffold110221_cov16-Prasinocladus_malaysianus.AAC.1
MKITTHRCTIDQTTLKMTMYKSVNICNAMQLQANILHLSGTCFEAVVHDDAHKEDCQQPDADRHAQPKRQARSPGCPPRRSTHARAPRTRQPAGHRGHTERRGWSSLSSD